MTKSQQKESVSKSTSSTRSSRYADKNGKDSIREERRIRNIGSAKRSRDRLKTQHKWMEIQMNENDDRMNNLKVQLTELIDEVSSTPSIKNRNKKKIREDDRPVWFGQPF